MTSGHFTDALRQARTRRKVSELELVAVLPRCCSPPRSACFWSCGTTRTEEQSGRRELIGALVSMGLVICGLPGSPALGAALAGVTPSGVRGRLSSFM